MSSHAHVAIDGPAGSGKTTVARALARRLNTLYLDTGAMYRALALLALERGADAGDEAALLALAGREPVEIARDPGSESGFTVTAGGRDLGAALQRNDVSRIVSLVAAHPGVRELMVERQRAIAVAGPVVMAGRDIGTVVLPDAPLKIFLTASVAARVRRRLAELRERGQAPDPGALHDQIVERDRLDRERVASPLIAAADAVEIDSSALGIAEVVDRIAELAQAVRGRR